MRPAKEFTAACERFGVTSTLELSFCRPAFAMRYQKLSPQLNHARVTRESCKRTVQAFHLFQNSAVSVQSFVCNNSSLTRGPSSFSIVQYCSTRVNYLSESLACLTVVEIMHVCRNELVSL